MLKEMKSPPLWVGSGAAYPFSETLAKRLTLMSKYESVFPLYKRQGNLLLVPRGLAPEGGEDRRVYGVNTPLKNLFVPRSSEQSRVVAESSALLLQGRSHIVEAPTGFGKTYVGSAIIANTGKKALVILTKEDIKSQWVKAFKDVLGLKSSEIGLIQGDTVSVANKKVVLAMVHSICKEGRYPSWVYQEFGLVVADEVHRMGADTFCQAMWLLPGALRLGLSASPYRKDGKDVVFKTQIGPVAVRSEAYPLIPRVMVLSSGAYLPPMKVQAGRTAHIDRMLSKNTVRNRLMAHFILKAWRKKRNILFLSSRLEHLQTMHDILIGVGVKASDIGFYVGGLTEAQRDVAKRKDVVMGTYQMVAEATDAPWWDTLILGTPRSDVLQIVGRVLREYEGKCNAGEENETQKCPIVLDVQDGALSILRRYADSRLKFYRKLGAPVKRISLEVAA